MTSIVQNVTTKTTRNITVILNDESLMHGIEKELALEAGEKIVSMKFVIPRGGDYSGMSVDPDDLVLQIVTEKSS